MTINTHVVFDNAFIASLASNVFPPDGIGTNSLGYITDAIAANIPGSYDCDGAATLLESYLAVVNLSADGTVFSRPNAGNFVCPGGNGAGLLRAQVFGFEIGNCAVTFTAGVPNLIFTDWPDAVIDPVTSPSFGLSWDSGGTSGDLITLSYLIPKVQSFDTAREYLGDNVAFCALAPTALPTIGGAVKCANFTRIFNPLNLPLRSK